MTVEAPRSSAITAETILRLFPDIDTTSTSELDGHDEEQIRLMDEVCIVLDENDEAIGTASKKICTCACATLMRCNGNLVTDSCAQVT